MTENTKRTGSIAEMIQRKLSHVIKQEINDPRLSGLVTLSGVEVARDLSHAKVYFTVFQDDPRVVEGVLNKASSFLRSALARTSTLRTVPQLHFIFDESIEYGQRLSQLIDAANPADDETSA